MRYRCLFWSEGGFSTIKRSRTLGASSPLEAVQTAYPRVLDETGLKAKNVLVTAPDGKANYYRIDASHRQNPDGSWTPGPHFDESMTIGHPTKPTLRELQTAVAAIFSDLERSPEDSGG